MSEDFTLPDLKGFNIHDVYDYSLAETDYEDLNKLNEHVAHARVALFKVTEKINIAERKARVARLEYERAFNRQYLRSTAKTASDKKIFASIQCEELENTCVYFEQIEKELSRIASTLRMELQTLQGVGNNLRQQMKMES